MNNSKPMQLNMNQLRKNAAPLNVPPKPEPKAPPEYKVNPEDVAMLQEWVSELLDPDYTRVLITNKPFVKNEYDTVYNIVITHKAIKILETNSSKKTSHAFSFQTLRLKLNDEFVDHSFLYQLGSKLKKMAIDLQTERATLKGEKQV